MRGFILTVLAVLGMVLLVYLILFFRKLIGTLRQVDEILSDAKVVSGIASDKAQLVDGIIDDAGEAVGSITDAIREPEHCCCGKQPGQYVFLP